MQPADSFQMPADGEAFQLLLWSQLERLERYIDRFIPPDLQATIGPQDVAQDTFFQAARVAGQMTFTDAESAWPWLVSIARNRLADLVAANRTAKRGGRLRRLVEGESRESLIVLLQELAVHERTPSRS